MRPLLFLASLGLIAVVMAIPADLEDQPNTLLDIADAGDVHSNDADRLVRQWGYGRGWGGGYGRGWGGGYGRGWGGGYGRGWGGGWGRGYGGGWGRRYWG